MSLAYAGEVRPRHRAARRRLQGARPLTGAVREKLARLVVENEVMRANGIRTLANFADGKAPGPESSIEKIYWSEFDKRFRETALDLLGPGGQLLRAQPARAARRRLGARVPVVARGDHLLRLVRDPAQHHRQARARPAAGPRDEVRALRRPGAAAQLDARLPRQASSRSRRPAASWSTKPRGYETPAWRQLAEMGYLGLARPRARAGGQGLGADRARHRAARRRAASCLPGPLLDVLLAAATARGGRRAGRARPRRSAPARRSSRIACARTRPIAGEAEQTTHFAHGRVKRPQVLRAVRRVGRRAVGGDRRRPRASIDGPFEVTPLADDRPGAALRRGDARSSRDAARADRRSSSATDRLAAVGAAATLLGVMSALARDHARLRPDARDVQAGRSARSRRSSTALADMLLKTESTRSAVYRAAWCLAADDPDSRARLRDGQGLRRRRRAARVRRGHPDARRHRLHVGARPAPLLQAREDATRCTTARPRRSSIASFPPSASDDADGGERVAFGGTRDRGAAAGEAGAADEERATSP